MTQNKGEFVEVTEPQHEPVMGAHGFGEVGRVSKIRRNALCF